MDPEVLLEPITEDSPSGENLEYDPVFVEMEQAAQPGEETQFDDPDDGGKEPDYGEVAVKALEIMGQSHDLRAAIYMADAALNTEGLSGFANATQVIRGYLEKYWETCFPELDADDDNDPTMRINAVQGLCGQPGGMAGPSAIYRSLRRVSLTDSRSFGGFSLRDIEIAEGHTPAPEGMDNPPDPTQVSAAFRDTDPFVPFVVWTIVGCTAWALLVGRGPLEWAVDRVTRLVGRAGRGVREPGAPGPVDRVDG